MAPRLSLSLLALALTPLGSCQTGDESIFGAGDEGLFGIPTSEYSDPDKANATGIITFDRSNVEYSLSIAVSADVPIPESDNFASTSVLSLGVESAERNLTTCVAIYSGLSANVTAASADLDAQDGFGCSKMLSEECISDFYSAASQGLNSDCSNFLPSVPASCESQFSDLSGVGSSFGNGSEKILYQYGTVHATKGDEAAWLAAATHIWPVITTTINVYNDSSAQSETYLNCIRPDTFSEGTLRPNATQNGTESGDSGSTGTPTTGGATPSPTNAASRSGLTVAALVGLGFNAAMFLM
ncbi:hypothetical protein N8I77_000306 [Diaporthe amygdali]|uniref:Uncharacterized protein n=1 Tax=Phomopsis amygdali TaxID=1214568 RepID=A0AAD9SLX3_PHOAM|nr:hypothetical protein N8I77_000306 [Diaporthe amygdali]